MTENKKIWIILFLLPCMVIFSLIYIAPISTVFITSFTKYTAFTKPVFIGIKNYIDVLSPNSDFWPALKNTMIWVVLQMTLHLGTGLIVALILYRHPKGWKAVRTLYLIPNIIPTAAMGVLFLLLLNPQFGIVRSAVKSLGITGVRIPNPFGNSDYSFFAVTLTWIFYSGFNTIIFLTEIGAIPKNTYEAAKIDGAKWWQVDLFVTLPLLRSSLKTCVILAAIAMVSQFDIIYVTTKGGPGTSTLNLPMLLYKTAALESNYGAANTIGVFQITIGLLLVLLINIGFQLIRGNKDE